MCCRSPILTVTTNVTTDMTDFSAVSAALAPAGLIRRPLRDLLIRLPQLPVTPTGAPDWNAADPDLLVELGTSAELLMQIVHAGLASTGVLHACSVRQLVDDAASIAHTATLGRLQVELAEMLLHVHTLATACRSYTSDYMPAQQKGGDDADSP